VWKLREGQRARMKLSSGQQIEGTLTAISVLADNTQRWMNPDVKEFPVDLVLDETPKGLKPGMRVECEILIDRVEQVLAVPLASIFAADGKSYVFVRNGDNGTRPLEVKIDKVNNEFAQITDGVKAGQDVKYLQVGEGADLLARAGIKISNEGSDKGGFTGGAARNGNRRGPNGNPAGPNGINAEGSGSATPNPTATTPPPGAGSEMNPTGAPPGGAEGNQRPAGGRRGSGGGGRRGGGGNGAPRDGGNGGAPAGGGGEQPSTPPGSQSTPK